jgi:hypothetical protein
MPSVSVLDQGHEPVVFIDLKDWQIKLAPKAEQSKEVSGDISPGVVDKKAETKV